MSLAPRFVYAVFNFPGGTDEDLPLVAGERIEVLSRDDEFGDGWWEGINEAGQQGLFPKIYTSETYPASSAGASLSSLSESLARVDEEGESETSEEPVRQITPVATTAAASSAASKSSEKPSMAIVEQWTPEEVSSHFAQLGLGHVSSKFVEHEVNGRILLAMQHTDLREIDINAFGKRFEIMREIDILRHTEQTDSQYMQQLGQHTTRGGSTPPLDIAQRSGARKSRIMPQQSATGAILADSTSSSDERDLPKVNPLVPRSNDLNEQDESSVVPALSRDVQGHERTDSGLGGSDISTGAAETPSTVNKSANITSLHRKSLSTSSVNLSAIKSEVTGRRSPEKRHSRSWSQDTVKINTHKRGMSGNLNAVGEEAAASLNSTDSGPRSPVSTPDSPASGKALSSPSSSARPTLIAKKSLLGRRPKWRPNAVSENLEQVSAPEAAKDADFSGWLRKRGERSYNWKVRYFVLKGTRLAYFQTDKDTSEKGLIDINSHKVVLVDDVLFYGPNRNTFKLVPPAPGASRALNFTPPKTHYFCADSKEQMRQWMAALTKATIGRDWSTPVISSCTTKTISLKAAREQRGMDKTEATSTSSSSTNSAANHGGLQPALDLDSHQTLPTSPDLRRSEGTNSDPLTKPALIRNESAASQSDTSMRRAVLGVQ